MVTMEHGNIGQRNSINYFSTQCNVTFILYFGSSPLMLPDTLKFQKLIKKVDWTQDMSGWHTEQHGGSVVSHCCLQVLWFPPAYTY